MTSKANRQRKREIAGASVSRNAFSFRYFKEEIEKLMNLNNLSEEEREDYIHEWYIMFREQEQPTAKEFVEWNFNPKEVNQDTHNYWMKLTNQP